MQPEDPKSNLISVSNGRRRLEQAKHNLTTYTFVNAMPVVEILASAMLVARVITLDSLDTRLRTKKKKRLVSVNNDLEKHGTVSELITQII